MMTLLNLIPMFIAWISLVVVIPILHKTNAQLNICSNTEPV